MENRVGLALKGVAMGIAEVIPGVSGGTIAFITGIYERLLNAIKSFDAKAIGLIFKGDFKQFWAKIDGNFLLTLFFGMATGLLSGVFVISYLIKNHIEPLWGFFFGLIIASVIYIGKQVKKWSLNNIILLIAGIALAYFLVAMHPMQGNRAYWYVFLSGVIAISALIMPGISGSFMLLILGMYTIIIPDVKTFLTTGSLDSLLLLAVFGTGMIVGLFTFARVMSWAFKYHHQNTLVILTGFMIGSLYKIWPWRIALSWLDKQNNTIQSGMESIAKITSEHNKVITEKLVMPSDYTISDPRTITVIVAMIIGFAIVFAMERYQNNED